MDSGPKKVSESSEWHRIIIIVIRVVGLSLIINDFYLAAGKDVIQKSKPVISGHACMATQEATSSRILNHFVFPQFHGYSNLQIYHVLFPSNIKRIRQLFFSGGTSKNFILFPCKCMLSCCRTYLTQRSISYDHKFY